MSQAVGLNVGAVTHSFVIILSSLFDSNESNPDYSAQNRLQHMGGSLLTTVEGSGGILLHTDRMAPFLSLSRWV